MGSEILSASWLEAVLHGFGHGKYTRVSNVATEAAAAAGDNYASMPTRLTAHVISGNGKKEKRKFVLKRRIVPPGPFAILSLRVFNNESAFYRHVVPAMECIVHSTVLSSEYIWPICYFSDSGHILMEDLKDIGYKTANRLDGLNESQCEGAIRALAHLHALSWVAIQRNMCPEILNRNLFLTDHLSDYVSGQLASFAVAVGEDWGSEWSNFSEQIRVAASSFQDKLRTLFEEPSKFKFVTHGDPWTTNFMFCDSGFKLKTKLVDFQLACMGTPGWDLNYVLHSSTNPHLFCNKIDYFLELYTSEFGNVLEAVGEDRNLGPSLQEIHADFDRMAPWGFFIAVTFAPIALCDVDDIPTTEDIFDPEKTLILYKKPKFIKFMKSFMPRFLELNVV